MAENSATQIGEILNQAIAIHTQNAISQLEFNKTEQAEIVDDTNKTNGDYMVYNGSIRYHAYTSVTTYKNKDKVYVLIPNNDYSQQKLILNKIKRSDTESLTYVSPLSQYQPLTGDILNLTNSSIDLSGYLEENISDYSANYSKDIGIGLIANYNKAAKNIGSEHALIYMSPVLTTQGEEYTKPFKYLGFSAKISTYLGTNISSGNYGLNIVVIYAARVAGKEQPLNYYAKTYKVRSADMIGAKYNYTSAYAHEALFTLDSYENPDIIISRIGVILYQEGDFKELDSNSRATVIATPGNDDNIFVRNLSIKLGGDLIEDGKYDIITISTPDGSTYDSSQTKDAYIEKTIDLTWVHIDPKDTTQEKITYTKLPKEVPCEIDDAIPRVTWFEDYRNYPNNYVEELDQTVEEKQKYYDHLTEIIDHYNLIYPEYYNWVEDWAKKINSGNIQTDADAVAAWRNFWGINDSSKEESERIKMLADKAYPIRYAAKIKEIELQVKDIADSSEKETRKNELIAEEKAKINEETGKTYYQQYEEEFYQLRDDLTYLVQELSLRESRDFFYDTTNKTMVLTETGLRRANNAIKRNRAGYDNYLKADSSLIEQGWRPIQVDKENSMSIDFLPNRKLNSCSVKCVVEYGPKVIQHDEEGNVIPAKESDEYNTSSPYYRKIVSNELHFINLSMVPEAASMDATLGLTFTYDDRSGGVYPLYDYSGRLIDQSNANRERIIRADIVSRFDGKSYINGNEKIIWKLPKDINGNTTMLDFNSFISGNDDADFVIPETKATQFIAFKNRGENNNEPILYEENQIVFNTVNIIINEGQENETTSEEIRYYRCKESYPKSLTGEGSYDNLAPTADGGAGYWERINYTSREEIVYPNHQKSMLAENDEVFTIAPDILSYDDDYYYIMYNATSTNKSYYKKIDSYPFYEIVDTKDNKPIPARNYIKYKLKNAYSPNINLRNLISCYLIKNNTIYTGYANFQFQNKGNSGTDYTLTFALGSLVSPKNIEILEGDGAEDTMFTVYESNDWVEEALPTEALTMGEVEFHRIIFSVTDPDGNQINLTNKQKNAIIRLWVDSESGYYSGKENADNLEFLCKKDEDNNYTDIAVRANPIIEDINELNYLILEFRINSNNFKDLVENEADVYYNGKAYNLGSINFSSLLPLNVRRTSDLSVKGSNYIYYDDAGALAQRSYTEYYIDNESTDDELEIIKNNFTLVQEAFSAVENGSEKETGSQKELYNTIADIYIKINGTDTTESELNELITEHFSPVTQPIAKIEKVNERYYIKNLEEINKSLQTYHDFWIDILNSIGKDVKEGEQDDVLTTLETFFMPTNNSGFTNGQTKVWTIETEMALKQRLINNFKAIYNEDTGVFKNKTVKQKVVSAIKKAISKEKSNWKKTQAKFKKERKTEQTINTKQEKQNKKDAKTYLKDYEVAKKAYDKDLKNIEAKIKEKTKKLESYKRKILASDENDWNYVVSVKGSVENELEKVRLKTLCNYYNKLVELLKEVQVVENLKEADYYCSLAIGTNDIIATYDGSEWDSELINGSLIEKKLEIEEKFNFKDTAVKGLKKDDGEWDENTEASLEDYKNIITTSLAKEKYNSGDWGLEDWKTVIDWVTYKAPSIIEKNKQAKNKEIDEREKAAKEAYEEEIKELNYCLALANYNGRLPSGTFDLNPLRIKIGEHLDLVKQLMNKYTVKNNGLTITDSEEEGKSILQAFDQLYTDVFLDAEERSGNFKVVVGKYDSDSLSYVDIGEGKDDRAKVYQYYPYFSENYSHKITANPFYVDGLNKEISVVCEQYGEWTYVMPIIMVKNEYQLPIINKWDGKMLLDEDNNAIYSATLAAGTKDNQNRFTGVLIGDIGKQSDSNRDSNLINGIYGYDKGLQSFGVKTDGTAFMGRSGLGQIKFDGNSGTIKSGGYSAENKVGTNIDLLQGDIDMYSQIKENIHIKDLDDSRFVNKENYQEVKDANGTVICYRWIESENKQHLLSVYEYNHIEDLTKILRLDDYSKITLTAENNEEIECYQYIQDDKEYLLSLNDKERLAKEGVPSINSEDDRDYVHIHIGGNLSSSNKGSSDWPTIQNTYFSITAPSTIQDCNNDEEHTLLSEEVRKEKPLIAIGQKSYFLQTADYGYDKETAKNRGLRLNLQTGELICNGKLTIIGDENSSITFGDPQNSDKYFRISSNEFEAKGMHIGEGSNADNLQINSIVTPYMSLKNDAVYLSTSQNKTEPKKETFITSVTINNVPNGGTEINFGSIEINVGTEEEPNIKTVEIQPKYLHVTTKEVWCFEDKN